MRILLAVDDSAVGEAVVKRVAKLAKKLKDAPELHVLSAVPRLSKAAEEEKGRFYTIWSDGEHVGDVTVLSRSQAAARIYDGQIYAPKPEYEGRIRRSGERFKTHDIYAAVRGVAKGAAAG